MALLAKKSGIVITWPMPIILSLVLTKDAIDILRHAKHMLSKTMMTKTPRMESGFMMICTCRMAARMITATAWKMPLTPAESALPNILDERDAGVDNNLFSNPRSRSQTTFIPKNIATNKADWANTPGVMNCR